MDSNSKNKTFNVDVKTCSDGDTFKGTVTFTTSTQTPEGKQATIRLLGLDAPEKGRPGADMATMFLKELILNKNVKVDWDIRDKYSRILGKVSVDGRSVNAAVKKNL